MNKINVGIIGFGLSGRYFFSPFIEKHPGFELKLIVTSQVDLVAEEYPQATVESHVDSLFLSGDIDLVVIASPNHTHFEYAKKALDNGKHVIMEKPFTVTSAEASELIQLAQSKSLILAPFQNRRWDGDFLTVKSIIEQQKLGEIVEFESHFDRYRPFYDRVAWKNEPMPGNGVLFDLGPHLIDQALALFGKPESVYADIKTHRDNGVVDDYFDLHLHYGKMKVILKAGVMVRENGPRFIVHGKNGSFIKHGIDPQENNLRSGMKPGDNMMGVDNKEFYGIIHTEENKKVIRERVITIEGNYMDYFQNVYKAITENSELLVKPDDGMLIIDLIEKAIESNKMKKVIVF